MAVSAKRWRRPVVLAVGLAVVVPTASSVHAYSRTTGVALVSAECGTFDPLYPSSMITKLTWDLDAGKPTKWELLDRNDLVFIFGKFTRKDLVAGFKVIGTECNGQDLEARISNRDSTSSRLNVV